MKRSFHIIALISLLCLCIAAAQLSPALPGDSGALVEKKYAGWNGVLRLWLCSRWSCGGSFLSWLNRCAAIFERTHPGVYVECTVVPEPALSTLSSSGMTPPEIVLFSPGVADSDAPFREIQSNAPDPLHHDFALPVCMGGYIRVCNPALLRESGDAALHLPDDAGRSFSLAAAALQPEAAGLEITDPGLDLGLPASARHDASLLDCFVQGQLPLLLVSQKELAQLIRLRDAGRGSEWECLLSNGLMIADQLLLAALPRTDADDGRAALAEAFILLLTTDECQAMLADIGAFSVNGQIIYPSTSPYAPLQAMLTQLDLLAPDFFSEYPSAGFEAIVRNRLLKAGEAPVFPKGKS